jgi:hypothetical protein
MLDEIARRAQEQYGWVRIHVQKDVGATLDERLVDAAREAHALLEQTADERTRKMRIEELSLKGLCPSSARLRYVRPSAGPTPGCQPPSRRSS